MQANEAVVPVIANATAARMNIFENMVIYIMPVLLRMKGKMRERTIIIITFQKRCIYILAG